MRYVLLFLSCFSLFVNVSTGQEVLENNPPSVKWNKINSPNFKVLYATGFEQQAQRVANTLEHIRKAESRSLGRSPRKISVILQNQSSESNGFVSLIPRRSEFYTMPPQDYNFGGTNDWLDQLATHEFRHIVQYENAKTGFNKVLYYMFGHATLAAMAGVSAPSWFWEGDAVATETAFTHSGRGRIPNFDLLMRTNFQEGRVFNYHKQYLRSYKHNIPDHYVLGYHMVGYLRKRTGDPDIWAKVTKRSWSVPFIPFAFSNALKKESGLYVTQLYRAMADDLQKTWQEELSSIQITPFDKIVSGKTKAYTSYSFPQQLSDGSILAMKNGIGDIEQFVVVRDGKEKKVFTPGFINDAGMLSASGTSVVWTEYGFDPRWRVKNYSVIKTYDIATNKYRIVTKNSRYAGASLSPDGKKIVTVESKTSYDLSIVVIDFASGQEVKRFSNPDTAFYSMPRWSNDGKEIVALKTKKARRSIVAIDYESAKETQLIAPSEVNIGHPVLSGNYVLYNSPVSGIDNIYVYDLLKKKSLQVTSSKYGAYNPNLSADGTKLYYNEQTRDGLDVVSIPFDSSAWKEFSVTKIKEYDAVITEHEGRPALLDSIPNNKFPVSKYSKLSGMVNPYSWGAYFNSSFTQADIGISSQDVLSTTSIKAGYLFDIYERTGAWHAGVSYQGLYPIVDAQVLFGNREDKFNAFGNSVAFNWKETTFEGGIRIPWLLTNSKYYREVEVGNYVGYTKVSSFSSEVFSGDSLLYNGSNRIVPFSTTIQNGKDTVDLVYLFSDQLNNGNLIYNRFYISYVNLLKRSRRDFLSRWGQTVSLEYYNTPYSGDFYGKLFAFRSAFYVPGFFKHHFLWSRIEYQSAYQAPEFNVYAFRNKIYKPRGYSYPYDKTFFTFSANYSFPVWYPDIAVGPLLNVQRIKANLFYDYGKGTGSKYYYGINDDAGDLYIGTTDAIYKSVGVETTFDINILRFLPKFEIGFRYTYFTANQFTGGKNGSSIEFLIGNIGF